MTPVYSADSSLDAQLVQDLLASAGITAHLLGPAMVDLHTAPHGGTHRVVVEDGEAEAARVLIADWQTGPADDDDAFDLLDSLPLEGEA